MSRAVWTVTAGILRRHLMRRLLNEFSEQFSYTEDKGPLDSQFVITGAVGHMEVLKEAIIQGSENDR